MEVKSSTVKLRSFLIGLNFIISLATIYGQKNISYSEALKIALDNNLSIKQVSNDIKVNKVQKSVGKLNYLPQLSANSNGARTKGFQFSPQEQALVDQEISTLRVNLRADLVVFNGFSNYYNTKRNSSLLNAKKQELEQIKQDIVFETTQNYLQYLLDGEILNISKENEGLNKLIYAQVSEFVKNGQRAGLDSISQLAVYERSKLNVTNSINKLTIDKLQLLRTLALNDIDAITFTTPIADEFQFDLTSNNSEDLINKAYSTRADLQRLYSEKEFQKQQKNFFKARRLPRASLFYRYGSEYISNRRRSNPDTNEFEDVPFRTQLFEENLVNQYGFNINVPILTNFGNRANIVRAKVEFENKDFEIQDLKNKIALDIRNSINSLSQLKQAYEVAKRASEASQLSFEKQKELYDLGLGDLITLNIESQRNFTAKSEELQAKYTLLFQQKVIDYQIGTILENESLK